MNKFVFMIFSVTVFFIGIGGVVKQIKTEFFKTRDFLVMIPRVDSETADKETVDFEKSLSLIEESKERVPFHLEETETPGADFQIKMRQPLPPEKVIEYHRQLSKVPLEEGLSLPRTSPNKTVIFLKKSAPASDPEVLVPTEASKVRVMINEEIQK